MTVYRSSVAAVAAIGLVLAVGAGSPASASTTVASGRDAVNDVKMIGPLSVGPSKKARKTIDIRRFEVVDNGRTRTVSIKVKNLATGRFGGRDQLFYFTSYAANGNSVAFGGFSHRPKDGGWSYSEINQQSCEFNNIRSSGKTNTITATLPATCFPVPSGGRVRVNTMVGTYRSDEPSYAIDKASIKVDNDW